jgi:hypothetical protein
MTLPRLTHKSGTASASLPCVSNHQSHRNASIRPNVGDGLAREATLGQVRARTFGDAITINQAYIRYKSPLSSSHKELQVTAVYGELASSSDNPKATVPWMSLTGKASSGPPSSMPNLARLPKLIPSG